MSALGVDKAKRKRRPGILRDTGYPVGSTRSTIPHDWAGGGETNGNAGNARLRRTGDTGVTVAEASIGAVKELFTRKRKPYRVQTARREREQAAPRGSMADGSTQQQHTTPT